MVLGLAVTANCSRRAPAIFLNVQRRWRNSRINSA
jgi:hypothetical protein